MNWNTILLVATIWVLTAIIGRLWVLYIRPWLDQHKLIEAATVAVHSAEELFGRYHGEEKLENALLQLSELGFDVDSDIVIRAVKAAWQKLNIEMISAGMKNPAPGDQPVGGQEGPAAE